MMFSNADLDRIVTGEIDLVFRTWSRRMHRAGGRQRTPRGVVAFTSVEPVDVADITEGDARRAGTDLPTLTGFLARKEGTAYRIGVVFAGADERAALREDADLSAADLTGIARTLAGMDARGHGGPWTRRYLELIAARPAELAETIGSSIGVERRPFKANVRRLKELGLTESLPTGYRLSPRGEVVLTYLRSADGGG